MMHLQIDETEHTMFTIMGSDPGVEVAFRGFDHQTDYDNPGPNTQVIYGNILIVSIIPQLIINQPGL